MASLDSFRTRSDLAVGGDRMAIFRLGKLPGSGVARLPYCLKVLLENLLRHEDGREVTSGQVEALSRWDPKSAVQPEVSFMPARVLLQDFTGVPCVVDLAAMRDAMAHLGGDPGKINPLLPVELVIDHSVQVDTAGVPDAFRLNAEMEFARNRERYSFLRWGQRAFHDFQVVPPDTGIVHQVNLEKLAVVVMRSGGLAYPDTLVGTDSHTTMINGLGVLGWGVGGIEAEAAMLGQGASMLVPPVVGVRIAGRLREGVTATDLVLTITELLRKRKVVGKFVEYFGPGLAALPLADRATIANMSPEYGATCGIFPIDDETLRYLRLSGRDPKLVQLVEAYAKEQGMWAADCAAAVYSETVDFDLASVEPSLAGPRRPQDRVPLGGVKAGFAAALPELLAAKTSTHKQVQTDAPGRAGSMAAAASQTAAIQATAVPAEAMAAHAGSQGAGNGHLDHGAVVIAAITSCTNTSNPSVMIGAGLLARKAVERGLRAKPWVKTSLAPGSKVVTGYLQRSGLAPFLDQLGFHLVGYGCTTCIGNSGPLAEDVSREIGERGLCVAAVLSGNRNFEGRIHPLVRANYLASPPLVVAYALAGRVDVDLSREPLGTDRQGRPVLLKDIWPSTEEVAKASEAAVGADLFRKEYSSVFEGDDRWNALPVPSGDRYAWDSGSTYIQEPPFFEGMRREAKPPADIRRARVLAVLGDSITTDHISPAGSIPADSPAGKYLISHGVTPKEFNSYGARRGNHQVMMRGTFANIRLKNLLVPGTEGGVTVHFPGGARMSIYDAAMQYAKEGVPLVVLAGKEYGSGSSRDWAAKGPRLLGVRAVIAESFERIHRSNLLFMGVLPLELRPGETVAGLGLTGEEEFDISLDGLAPRAEIPVWATGRGGRKLELRAVARVDTPKELEYFQHGGILQYVLRQLLK